MKKVFYILPVLALALSACQAGVPFWESGQVSGEQGGNLTTEEVQEMIDKAVADVPMPEPGISAQEVRDIFREEMASAQSGQPAQPEQPALEPIPGDRDGEGCDDKLYTYPANDQGILYDFEIQSEVVQMNDFYTPGNPTILVLERAIEPNERSDYALGWGSAWGLFTDRPGCENFDIVGNAVSHAESRLDQGHAGLVVDFRDGETALVVAMLPDLPKAEAERLWDMYTGARHDGEDAVPADLTFSEEMIFLEWPEGAELLPAVGACPATRGRDFGAGQAVGPYDHYVVLQPWGDTVPSGQVNYILPAGETVTFPVGVKGGATWEYPTTCGLNQVVQDLTGNPLPLYHLEGGAWVAGPPSK